MRRFSRRFSEVRSAVSLLLLAFVVALWVRSYRVGEQVGYRSVGAGASITQTSLATFGGRLALSRSSVVAPGTTEQSGWYVEGRHPRPGYATDGVAGFEFRRVASQGRWLWELRVPMWALAAVLTLQPVLQMRSALRRRRLQKPGVCCHCGYDLRGSTGRCPECGTVTRPQAG